MSPAARNRMKSAAPWVALALTVAGMLFTDGVTWGQTCQRVQAVETETTGVKAEMQEIRAEMQAQFVGIETRLRTVEQATQAIPGMAQDIRDIRDYLLEEQR